MGNSPYSRIPLDGDSSEELGHNMNFGTPKILGVVVLGYLDLEMYFTQLEIKCMYLSYL